MPITQLLKHLLLSLTLIHLTKSTLRCYTPEEVSKKLKSDSNVLKYLKKGCPKISKSELSTDYGTRTMKLEEDMNSNTFVYMTNDLKFFQVEFLNLEANLELAKRLNQEVCIKEILPEDTHRFFNFMIDCRVISKKIAVVSQYFPENQTFKQYIKNNFPSIYTYQMDTSYRAIMDKMLFDLANALNILHNHQIILNNITMDSIVLTSDARALFKDLSKVTIKDEPWQMYKTNSYYDDLNTKDEIKNGYSLDIFRLGIVFFQMLNGIKAPEYLEEYMGGHFIFLDNDNGVKGLTYPENFGWMSRLVDIPITRLCSNQVVRGIAQNISIRVHYEDFQGHEQPEYMKMKKHKKDKKTLRKKEKKPDSFEKKTHANLEIMEGYLGSENLKQKLQITEEMTTIDNPIRVFKVNEPDTASDSLYGYKMGALNMNSALTGSNMLFLI